MLALSDALWRGLLLVVLGLAPWAGPAEAAPATSSRTAVVRLVFVAMALALAALGIRTVARSSRAAAVVCALAIFITFGCSLAFAGARGPLASGFYIAVPLVWSAVGAVLAGPVLDARNAEGSISRRRRLGWFAVAIALGAISLALGWRRIGSREGRLRAALVSDPGNESLAMAWAALAGAKNRTDVLRDCVKTNARACGCFAEYASIQVDEGEYAGVLAGTDHLDQSCTNTPGLLGLAAESQAGVGRGEEALGTARIALGMDSKDQHAAYARALVLAGRGDHALAEPLARLAVKLGRGQRAHLLLGEILCELGKFQEARAELDEVLKGDPRNVTALFNRALAGERLGNYRDAREGYLAVLRVEPRNGSARFRLGAMAHAAGADLEAKHHLEELVKIDPGAPQVEQLRQMLDSSPAPNAP